MSLYRAGDGNRTRPTSLEGSGAATTLRPPGSLLMLAARAPRFSRNFAPVVGQSARWPGAVPVVAGTVERDDRSAEAAAQRRGQQRDQPRVLLGASQAPERHAARRTRAHRVGVLLDRLGLEVPGRDGAHRDAVASPLRRQLARQPLDR